MPGPSLGEGQVTPGAIGDHVAVKRHVSTSDTAVAVRRVLMSDKDSSPKSSSLAEKLAAAKPVSWRGHGDLPQYSWANPPLRGSWLVLDLWSGYSGLCLALLSLGVHFYALAADTDPTCRACAQESMPQIVHVDAVEHVQARLLRPTSNAAIFGASL